MFDWEKAFSNTSVKFSNFQQNYIKHEFNYNPHESVVFNDRGPPWLNDKITFLIQEETTAYKYYRQNGNDA